MSIRADFKITGAKEIEAVLKKLPAKVQKKALNQAVRAGARVIQKDAIKRAPVLPGRGRILKTKKGIVVARKARGEGRGAKVGRISVGLSGSAFFGLYWEFGTTTIPARPFMRPAFEATKKEVVEAIGKKLGDAVEKGARDLAGPYAKSGLARKKRRRRR
tara:strand:- start:431 stop:910 length:480 start_codon:yes stop_codon:yes gene_type:complete